jgi:hypothetical protein
MIAVSNILPLPNPPLIKAIVYTQVKLPPLIPRCFGGKPKKLVPSPKHRGGLGWGNLRNNGDSITCVYTVALSRGGNWIFIVSPLRGKGVQRKKQQETEKTHV